jgi:hypothetical protein
MTITIPDGFWDKYREACDFFIDDNHIGKSCTLVYPARRIICDNCIVNTIGGTSTNSYKHGGLAPFNFGNCPLCGGNGYHEEEITDSIRLRIYWRQKDWIKVSNISIPDADVQVIGYLSDLPNLRKANEVILVNETTHGEWRVILSGEPFLHGFGKDRYFVAFLKRI